MFPESFVTSSISVERELRGAGHRTADQEWMIVSIHSKKAEIEVLDDTLPRTLQVWSW